MTTAPRATTLLSLVLTLAAGGTLVLAGPAAGPPPPPPDRQPAAQAWPEARAARLPPALADGTPFQPLLFVDAGTAFGTAPTRGGEHLRLLLFRADGTETPLRQVPLDNGPMIENSTAAGDDLVWTETSGDAPAELWTTSLRSPAPRRLTRDTGRAVFYGSEGDLVITGGRVHWAATARTAETTEIRSVALAGGPVRVRTEAGVWALSHWPWLVGAGSDSVGVSRLRDPDTGRVIEIPETPTELVTCNPSWCRVTVVGADYGQIRVDLMHPDGSARRPVAGPDAQVALNDVAVLDRFEVFSERTPNSDLTGVAGLLAYDLKADRTVLLSPAVRNARHRNGLIWWSTGDPDRPTWSSIDLRTVR